jgi:ABC-type multidrug transport system fused ATPase/permease subunit
MNVFHKAYHLLSSRERIRIRLYLIISIIVALIDTLGMASIAPFIALLTNSEGVLSNYYALIFYKFLDCKNLLQFQIIVGSISLVLIVISAVSRATVAYLQLRLVMDCEVGIGNRLVIGWLKKPYAWYLSQHSSNLTKLIFSDTPKIIGEVLNPTLTLITQLFLIPIILIMLMYVNYKIVIFSGIGFGTIYLILNKFTKNITTIHGVNRFIYNESRHKILSNILGGIREIKAGKNEQYFVNKFTDVSLSYARAHSIASLTYSVPRYLIEGLVLGALMGFILLLLMGKEDIGGILPSISVFVIAAYRLMPATQSVYSSLNQIAFAGTNLDAVYKYYDLQSIENLPYRILPENIRFERMKLINVGYSYPGSERSSIKNITININSGEFIGVMGSSGSGKTTLIDVLIGLLEPKFGSIILNDVFMNLDLSSRPSGWVGYVPQQIFLLDDTITSNIAFGISKGLVDKESVQNAAYLANLDEFIKHLEKGYESKIGERGAQLSGGQRQRIGIARALYHNPSILILDEGTNALNMEITSEILKRIRIFNPFLTIILVSHQLDTLINCDKLIVLEKGEIVAEGAPEELLKNMNMTQYYGKK